MALWHVWSENPGIETSVRIDGLIPFNGMPEAECPGAEAVETRVYKTQRLGTVMFSGEKPLRNADPVSPFHEMLTHVPMCSHPHPTRALVVGGSDGFVLELLLSYASIESVHVAGFSKNSASIAAAAFPGAEEAFGDRRVSISGADAAEFARESRERFDVIVFDPMESLKAPSFPQSFFCDCFRLLTVDGVMACDCGASDPSNSLRETAAVIGKIRRLFPVFRAYQSPGRLGVSAPRIFGFASKTIDPAVASPTMLWKKDGAKALWYNEAVHRAAFAMPTTVVSMLETV